METKFKLRFETDPPDIELETFRQSLPSDFIVSEEADGLYVSIPSQEPEDCRCQYLIDRELDRHFFLTAVKITAHMVTKTVSVAHTAKWRIHGALPEGITPQKWTYELPIQLRLWSMAVDTNDPQSRILLFYQVIELAYPNKSDYPDYIDSSKPPHPRTECKLIRHLVTHSGEVRGTQLKRYCEYLGLPYLMLDPTDPYYVRTIAEKAALVEREATNAISRSL